jgi:hypothetical protein
MSKRSGLVLGACAMVVGCGGGGTSSDAAAPADGAAATDVLDGDATVLALDSGADAGSARLVARTMAQDLGAAVAGATTPTTTITISNDGGAASGVPVVTVSGMGFRLVANGCASSLAAREFCSVQLAFAAPAVGSYTGTLSVTAAPGGTALVALSGRGFSGTSQVMPSAADFGGVVVGQASRVGTFTLSNTGGETIPMVMVEIQGDDYAFSTSGDCHAPLPPGATCVIEVRLEPRKAGVRPGLLIVTAGRDVTAVPLTGTGLSAAALVVSPMARSFSAVAVRMTGRAEVFTVGNVGDVPSGPITVKLTGPDATDFELVTSDCQRAIPSFGTCEAKVAFRPLSEGMKTATVTFEAAPGGMASAGLSGLVN